MKKSLIIILLFLVTISWMSWGAFVIYFDEFELFKFVFFLFLLGVTFLVLQNLNFLRAKHEIGLFRSQFLFGIKCVLIFFIFAVLHYLNSFQPWSIDLTFQKLYKVRDEGLELTKNLAKKQKIEFTFWGTREHWNQAEELLGNYKKASSHVKLQWINPDQKPEMAKMIEGRQLPLLHIVFGDKKKWVENIDEWNINFALNALRDKKNSGLCFLASHQTLSLDDESTMGLSYLKTLIQSEGFRVHTIGLDDPNTLETCHAFMLMGPQDDFLPHEITQLKIIASKIPVVIALGANNDDSRLKNLKTWLKNHHIVTTGTPVLDQSVLQFGEDAINVLWESQWHDVPTEWGLLKKIKGRVLWQLTTAFEKDHTVTPLMWSQSFPQTWQESSWKEVLSGKVTFDEKSDKKGPLALMVAARTSDLYHLVVAGTDKLWMNGFKNYPANFSLFLTLSNTLLGVQTEQDPPPIILKEERLYLHSAQANVIFYLSIIVMPILMLGSAYIVFRKNSFFKK